MKATSLALCTILSCVESAFADSQKIDVLSYAASFETSKGAVNKSVISPVGAMVSYEYRRGFYDAYSAQYSVLSSGNKTLIQGLTLSINYALYGGHPQLITFPKNTVVRYQFPFKISVFGGIAGRIYDITSMYPKGKIVIPSSVALETGKFIGGEFGVNLERSLFGPISMSFQTSYVVPYFISSTEQKGSLISLGAGLGAEF